MFINFTLKFYSQSIKSIFSFISTFQSFNISLYDNFLCKFMLRSMCVRVRACVCCVFTGCPVLGLTATAGWAGCGW